jgi:hypothetical protein
MALGKYQIMIFLLVMNMFFFPMIASAYTMPGITNPLSDLIPGFAQSASGTGAGTSCVDPTCGTVGSSQQNIQSCLVGAGGGALTGALVGSIVPGVGTLVGAIGGAIIGGFTGCGIASTFFPSQGSSLFTSVANSAGPLGDFMKAISTALAWVGPMLKFFQDMVFYEFALFVSAPEIGVWLFPLQAVTGIFFLYLGAEYIRGVGTGVG